MKKYLLTKITEVPAHGGPAVESPGKDGHKMTPTRAGRFIIHSISKHISQAMYAAWSGIPWGTPVLIEDYVVKVDVGKGFVRLSSVAPFWKGYVAQHSEWEATDVILEYYHRLGYADAGPSSWVFSDFGHVTVKYFKDLNGNRKLDKDEHVLTDFIHTTPHNEAQAALKVPITLAQSHGCVHITPGDMDDLRTNYIRIGHVFEVHPYSDTPSDAVMRSFGLPEFEVHFFPGALKIFVYKVQRIVSS